MVGKPKTLESELARLREENARLAVEVERLNAALAEALTRIEELEGGPKPKASFVKPNRPQREGEKRLRKKRVAEHNTSRKRMAPTRQVRHALEHCPVSA